MEEIKALAEEFKACRKTLSALGDENRQHLILEMMQMGNCGGVRVGAITEKTHLSRPAASHHLQILREARLIKMRREGKKTITILTQTQKQWKVFCGCLRTQRK